MTEQTQTAAPYTARRKDGDWLIVYNGTIYAKRDGSWVTLNAPTTPSESPGYTILLEDPPVEVLAEALAGCLTAGTDG